MDSRQPSDAASSETLDHLCELKRSDPIISAILTGHFCIEWSLAVNAAQKQREESAERAAILDTQQKNLYENAVHDKKKNRRAQRPIIIIIVVAHRRFNATVCHAEGKNAPYARVISRFFLSTLLRRLDVLLASRSFNFVQSSDKAT